MQKALQNICPIAQFKISKTPSNLTIVRGKAHGLEAITTLARKFRDQRILEAVRQSLLKNVKESTLLFGLNRQAALMNRFHLSNLDEYSAMGPIRIEIQANNIYDVIDYISPPTVKGKPQIRKDLQLE